MFRDKKEFVYALCLWIVIFAIYNWTLARSVGFIDSGELATVASTLGIAHPTGYPLFTLLGRFFVMIPTAQEEIVRLNVMSALFTSLASAAFFLLALELLERNREKRSSALYGSAAFATLALSFSQTFWRQAVAVEVYSLHLLLVCVSLWALIKAVNTGGSVWWFLFAFVLGLSFTNHLTTILLIPAVVYLFLREYGIGRGTLRRIARLSVPFLIGLSVYCFLPLRAAGSPLLNWGNPQTLERFLWHVSGKQFRVWMFTSTESAQRQLQYFFSRVPEEFFYIPFVIALIGFFVLLFKDRRNFVFLSLLIVTCVGYSINYDIHDIDSYFLLAHVALMLCAAAGFRFLLRTLSMEEGTTVIAAVVLILPAVQIYGNWKQADQSRNFYVEDYTKSILTSLPERSIILSYQWDYFVSAALYFQHVKQYRPDIIVLDKELFRRSWYFDQLQTMYPEVVQRSQQEIDAFKRELYKFEHDLPYDYSAIEGRYAALLRSFIEKNIETVPVFVTGEIEQAYTAEYNRIPFGLVYKLTQQNEYVPSPFPELSSRSAVIQDKYIVQMKGIVSSLLYQRGMYEMTFSRDSLSSLYITASKNVAK